MDKNSLLENICPIARGLHRVGDTWSMLILRNAGAGETRFDQFQKGLGIAPNILARRLAALVAEGLLEKHRYSERPPRDEYRLTDTGRAFLPVLYALGAWGGRHFASGDVSGLVDNATGNAVEPIVVDRRTLSPLADMDLRVAAPRATLNAAHRVSSSELPVC